MGSGDRFTFGRNQGFGFGVYFMRFPFDYTFSITFALWYVSYGFGRAYDDTGRPA